MKKNAVIKTISLFFCLLSANFTSLNAQTAQGDFMQSIGKVYVVVAVIVTVFIGIVFFLVYLDRKLTKLENQINDND